MFGRGAGFLKFKADVLDKETGTKIPGIVFARGQSVAVLVILESGGKDYVVLTEQVRVPVGRFTLELPAGMLDDDGDDVVGAAVREGGCDEELSLFLYRGCVEEEIINSLQGKEMGLRDHGELIKVHVVPYDKLWCMTADAKALAAVTLYEMAQRNGFLPLRRLS
ncbi:ADP-sugar diphosphatase protein [Dioscorea alata]|nr:ADP-sugar diphosphatase protein [Dioscorea alata]